MIPRGAPARVLVVLPHPDDPEYFCGGTIARWAREGREVIYCLLTRGEKGSDDPATDPSQLARTREAEQRKAAAVLGVRQVQFLDFVDGELAETTSLRRDIVRVIRQLRPQIVVTCDPSPLSDAFINHADHRAAGQATLDAVYPAAGSGMYFPELTRDEGLEPHKVREVYVSLAGHPNWIQDVTEELPDKVRALREHRSQIDRPDELEARLQEWMRDPESPPSAPRYVEKFLRIELE
jgi:LmbE family N-acetylglucosaminyl deacetylase